MNIHSPSESGDLESVLINEYKHHWPQLTDEQLAKIKRASDNPDSFSPESIQRAIADLRSKGIIPDPKP